MQEEEKIIAFLKYEGKLVEDGYLDARKSGEALVGIDELLRYFLLQEDPSISGFEFEIPVRVRRGSWETIFPENIDSFVLKGLAIWMAGKYAGTALSEIAKNDFKDVSFKVLLKKAFRDIINVIKLSKHLGTLTKKKFENITFSENNDLVKMINEKGEELWIPVEALELYANCPQNIFNKITKVIEEERELAIGYNEGSINVEEKITYTHKYIFSKIEEDDELILPELKHGEYVELEGHITRGNEKSNTIGFLYSDHIITCIPDKGNVKEYKGFLFNNCKLKGLVDRVDKEGAIKEKRPRIRFSQIINLDKPTLTLFD